MISKPLVITTLMVATIILSLSQAQLMNNVFNQKLACTMLCAQDLVLSKGCECCPPVGSECNKKYNGTYCNSTTQEILYSNIPKTCPQNAITCQNSCELNFDQTFACDCCPTAGKECNATLYGNKFCDAAGHFIMTNFPQTCPQRQDSTNCTNSCAYGYFQQQTCDCCPTIGQECEPLYNGQYCDAKGNLNITAFPLSCPQASMVSITCPNACSVDMYQTPVCDCCPNIGAECKDEFNGIYCDAVTQKLNYTAFPQSCRQVIEKNMEKCSTTCLANQFQTFDCDCCPNIGDECNSVYNGQFCPDGTTLDLTTIPESCPQQKISQVCAGTMCPSQYLVGSDCSCCPFPGMETSSIYGGIYGDEKRGLDLTQIPQGCPTWQAFEWYCEKDLCDSNHWQTYGCECCPVLGQECSPLYNGKYCGQNDFYDLQLIPTSCVQWYYPQCDSSWCGENYTQGTYCSCCPEIYNECASEYNGFYCDADSNVLLNNIPFDCPQHQQKRNCDATVIKENNAWVEKYDNLFITPECEVCPFLGQECVKNDQQTSTDQFCFFGSVNLNAIPKSCPQKKKLNDKGCDTSIYTQLADGTCCPFVGQECDAAYSNYYCDYQGKLLLQNIPQGCPSLSHDECGWSCWGKYFQTDKCECCPFEGLECDPVYDGAYCNPNGLFILDHFSNSCPQKQNPMCDPNFEFPAINSYGGKICCPNFKFTALSPFYEGKNIVDGIPELGMTPDFMQLASECATYFYEQTLPGQSVCPSIYETIPTPDPSKKTVCCPIQGQECKSYYQGQYCDKEGNLILTNIPKECPQSQVPCNPFMFTTSEKGECCPFIGEECNADLYGEGTTNPFCINGFVQTFNMPRSCQQDYIFECPSACDPQFYQIKGFKTCSCCPFVGMECFAELYGADTYCTNGLLDPTKITGLDAECPQTKSSLCSSCPISGADYIQIFDQPECSCCPLVGKECDAMYSGAYCNVSGQIILTNIPPACPQRARNLSTCIPTMFQINSDINQCCPYSGHECDAVYNDAYCVSNTISTSLGNGCFDEKPQENKCETSCDYYLFYQDLRSCECCPFTGFECGGWYGNEFCDKSGTILLDKIPSSCSSHAQVMVCPPQVTCGDGFTMSSTCQCCPIEGDEFNTIYNGYFGNAKQGINYANIPESCPTVLNAKICPDNYTVSVNLSCCPIIGKECDTYLYPNDGWCQDGQIDKNGPISTNSCIQAYLPVCEYPCGPNYTTTSNCECCPFVGHECDPVYFWSSFCDSDGNVQFQNIPSSCPQVLDSILCPMDLYTQKEDGQCCPLAGHECHLEYEWQFCNPDGSLNWWNFGSCPLPQCEFYCDELHVQNGCSCCPLPGFALDPAYNYQYTTWYGEPDIPEECQTLNGFTVQPQFRAPADFYIRGLIGNQEEQPRYTLQEFGAMGFTPTINTLTQGRIDSIFAMNRIGDYLNDPSIQTLGAEIIKELKNNDTTLFPPNLIDILGGYDFFFNNNEQQYNVTFFDILPKPFIPAKAQNATDFQNITYDSKLFQLLVLGYGNPWFQYSVFSTNHALDFGVRTIIRNPITQGKITDYSLWIKYEFALTAALTVWLKGNLTMDQTLYVASKLEKNQTLSDYNNQELSYLLVKMQMDDGLLKISRNPAGYEDIDILAYNVFAYEQLYPGLQQIASGQNPMREIFFYDFKKAAQTLNSGIGVTADSFENQQVLMGLAQGILEGYQQTFPNWSPYQTPLQYTGDQIYTYGLQIFIQPKEVLDSNAMNKIMDIAVNQITNGIFKNDFKANFGLWTTTAAPLLSFININPLQITPPTRRNLQVGYFGQPPYTSEQASGYIALELFYAQLEVNDIVIPTFSDTELEAYGLDLYTVTQNHLSPKDIAKVMGIAKEGEPYITTSYANYVAIAFQGVSDSQMAKYSTQYKAGKTALWYYLSQRTKNAQSQKSGVNEITKIPIDDFQLAQLGFSRLMIQQGLVSLPEIYATFLSSQYVYNVKSGIQNSNEDAATALALLLNPSLTDDQLATEVGIILTSAGFGFVPRVQEEWTQYFPTIQQAGNSIQNARLSEKDFMEIDQNYVSFGLDNGVFQYTIQDLQNIGLQATQVGPNAQYQSSSQLQKLLYSYQVYAKKQSERTWLYNYASLPDFMAYFGFPIDYIQAELQLTEEYIMNNLDTINSEVLAQMIFENKYGPLCEITQLATCVTGEQNPDFKYIAAAAGLTRTIWEGRFMSLLEVMKIVNDFTSYNQADSRNNLSFGKLYKLSNPNDANYDPTAVYRLASFSNPTINAEWLVNNGVVCVADLYGDDATAASTNNWVDPAFKSDDGTVLYKYCEQFSNQASPFSRLIPLSMDLIAPKTNIDVLRKTISPDQFQAFIDYLPNGGVQSVEADQIFIYSGFEAAVAKLPSFCSVYEPQEECARQVAAFMAVTRQLTGGFRTNANVIDCDPNKDFSCAYFPPIESLEYHWLIEIGMSLCAKHNCDPTIISYKPRGAGLLTGAQQYWRFFQAIGQEQWFVDPEQVNGSYNIELTAQLESAISWGMGLWRFMSPVYHSRLQKFTEVQSPKNAQFYVKFEDSYLTPSPNTWLRGYNVNDNVISEVFGGNASGLVGVLKSYFPSTCTGTPGADAKQVAEDFVYFSRQLVKDAKWIVDVTQANDCTKVVGTEEIQFMPSFNGKNYYSSEATTIDETFQSTKFSAKYGSCYNVFLETPYTVFSSNGYADCQARSTASLTNYYDVPINAGIAIDDLPVY